MGNHFPPRRAAWPRREPYLLAPGFGSRGVLLLFPLHLLDVVEHRIRALSGSSPLLHRPPGYAHRPICCRTRFHARDRPPLVDRGDEPCRSVLRLRLPDVQGEGDVRRGRLLTGLRRRAPRYAFPRRAWERETFRFGSRKL